MGSYVAVDTAAHDGRVTAIAVLDGGMADATVGALGAAADQITYSGREHGFDFSDTDPMTNDAVGRGSSKPTC